MLSVQQAFFSSIETVLQLAGVGGFSSSAISSGAILISQEKDHRNN